MIDFSSFLMGFVCATIIWVLVVVIKESKNPVHLIDQRIDQAEAKVWILSVALVNAYTRSVFHPRDSTDDRLVVLPFVSEEAGSLRLRCEPKTQLGYMDKVSFELPDDILMCYQTHIKVRPKKRRGFLSRFIGK